MKNILNLFALFLLLLAACEPMEDVYNELDEKKAPYSKSIELKLGEADYATIANLIKRKENNPTAQDSANASAISSNKFFSDAIPASLYVPYFLGDEFLALKKDSRALVTYNYAPQAADLSHLELMHKLTANDYAAIDPLLEELAAFAPSWPADDYLQGIIGDKFPEAPDNSVAYIDYRVSDIDPSQSGESPVIFREDFNGTLGTFTQVSIVGDQTWRFRSYGDDQYAEMSGYASGTRYDNDDYLISPAIDLSNNETASFKTRQMINFLDGVWENIQILVSTNYDGSGDVAGATWNELTLTTKPAGTNYDFVESESVDLADYIGQSAVYFAFRYQSQSVTGVASTWRVDWMTIETSDAPKPKYTYFKEFYQKKNNQWKLIEEDDFNDDIYVLKDEDYKAMGNPGPGNHNNFSGSDSPDDYLPQMLKAKHLYASEGDITDVVYLFYENRQTNPKASRYEYTNGGWENTARVTERSEQFVHNGEKWVFDPTVVFTMTNDDYAYIVNYVRTEIENGANYIDRDNEYYFGASSYYANFDLRLNKRKDMGVPGFDTGSVEEQVELTYQRMAEAVELMLKLKYPDAVTQVNGVEVHYMVTLNTYENDLSRNDYVYDFKCIKSGPNPEFELVSGPDLVE